MKRQVKFLTDLTSEEAMDLLMTTDQFHSFELPEYFDFTPVLNHVRGIIGDRKYEDCLGEDCPAELSDVNFEIMLNKDGKYAVRPLMLCNPYLYYFMVREIFGRENWDMIKEHFRECRVGHIVPCAMPVVPEKVESFRHSTSILNWWNSMEQRAIELSLEYRYMFVSDITNCYGSVNPQAIDWALSRRGTSMECTGNHAPARNIMRYLRDFQQGRNIGIPQGCAMFDLTAEMILCYSDLLLHEELVRKGIHDGYEILRYRDDYKIFCNDRDRLETISYTLQHVLESLNFRMNSSKTRISDSIITDSVKQDKLFYIFNTPIFNKKGCDFDGIQKHLMYILMFGRKFPDAGQLKTLLGDLDKRVAALMEPDPGNDGKTARGTRENIRAMSAIATQIAYENLSCAHYALRIISRLTASMRDEEERTDIIRKVCDRLYSQPNSTYSKLWLQNMTYSHDAMTGNVSRYDVSLCRIVMGENIPLWNNNWLKPELTDGFSQCPIVNKDTLAKVTPVITFKEKRAYDEAYESMDNIDFEDIILEAE